MVEAPHTTVSACPVKFVTWPARRIAREFLSSRPLANFDGWADISEKVFARRLRPPERLRRAVHRAIHRLTVCLPLVAKWTDCTP